MKVVIPKHKSDLASRGGSSLERELTGTLPPAMDVAQSVAGTPSDAKKEQMKQEAEALKRVETKIEAGDVHVPHGFLHGLPWRQSLGLSSSSSAKEKIAEKAKKKAEEEAKAKAEKAKEAGSSATGGNSGPTHVRAKHFEAKVLFLLVDQCVRLRRRRRKPRKRNRRSSPHGLWTRKCLQKAGHHGS